ncbi:TFP11-domain-containing protein [Calocera cornea HHB12733]|uniref:TFP11-domain-containing protein n=1 Tax=Calocera cornea HHB12733 TaxID=1353952 RepID=A0A165HM04_9BASI|nr:TFP11-domain-containing protein [Calocera cornea HHB12733]
MARRKQKFLSDDDSSENSGAEEEGDDFDPNENPDERAERELFSNPYGRNKKRKRRDMDDEDDEDEGFGGRPKPARKRTDWTKAPSFVSGGPKKLEDKLVEDGGSSDDAGEEENLAPEGIEDLDAEAEAIEDEGNEDEDEEMEVSEDDAPAPEPRIREASEEPKPPRSGFGAARSMMSAFSSGGDPRAALSPAVEVATPRGGIGSRGGIGAGRGGSGSTTATAPLPSSFGSSSTPQERPRQSFVRSATPTTPAPANLTPAEKRHFDSLQNTFGAKLMAKMGWQAGQGLGAEGKGIVNPIETKLRPMKAGIAFRGFKERTDQSKAEAKRRGETVSDDEDEKPKKGRKGRAGDRSEMWKKPAKKAKVKVEHKTYEELIREAGGEAAAAVPGVGVIIDATGPEMREVSSMSEATASWAPTADPTRLPEVRHNLRVIVDMAKGELDGLAREGKALDERGKYLATEGKRLGSVIRQEAELIARLQRIRIVVDQIAEDAREIASTYEPSLDPFEKSFETLLNEFSADYEKFGLDEIIVGAMTPVVKRMVANWDPLADPETLSQPLQRWKSAFRLRPARPPDTQVQLHDRFSRKPSQVEEKASVMTAYESLIWNVWLPRVRSSINNSWNPADPDPAILLYKTWAPLLPDFIQANILDQLVLPKLSKAVADWNWRKSVPLHSMVFPWLEHLGLRSEQLLDDCRRKIKAVLKAWSVEDGMWTQINAWRDIFPKSEWDNMLLKLIVPKLGATLREAFKVNPRDQKMEPLDSVLAWRDVLRSAVMGQLLEKEFFPKWLNTLHFWLVQPKTSFEDVAQWYSFWKGYMPASINKLEPVEQGFNRGLHLMNMAMELGANAPQQLPKPETLLPKKAAPSGRVHNGLPKAAQPAAEVTFRSIVEDFVATHNLLFFPTGQAHEKSRMPLYHVSPSVDGKGGVTVYLLDDAVWMQDGVDWKAVSLEEMVLRANRVGARQR